MNEAPPKFAIVLTAFGVLFLASSAVLVSPLDYLISQVVSNAPWVGIGAVLYFRRAGGAIGPILMTIGLGWNMAIAADVLAESLVDSGQVSAASWLALVATMITLPLLWLLVPLLLLFPQGHSPSPIIRRLLQVSAIYTALLVVLEAFTRPTILDPTAVGYPHPFLNNTIAPETLIPLTLPLLLLQFVSAGILIARVRHSGPLERRQITWVGLAVAIFVVVSLVAVFVNPLGDEHHASHLLDAVGFVLLPLAIGVAISRYRLYEIDTIISRSVTFGALAVFIGGVYIAIVVGVGSLLGGGAGFGLSIVASVFVAMAFQPVRRRVERWANRLVYGVRATPYEVLVRFSHRSAELSDEELLDRIPRLIVDGTGAATATLWSQSEHGFRTGSVWTTDSADRYLDGSNGFVDPEADFSASVTHDGEVLGGLSLVKAGGETVTPAEQALLRDLASGLGLALRNARLTGQLRRQVGELEASRERVLAASDEARRALENDLDSGPQQQLVALKVKLGPTRMLAERAGAVKTATLLAKLESEAGDAIQAVRDFAGGIYPSLLEAEGLKLAIGQQARSAAIPVRIYAETIGRYSREVEAAVYFSVLEALQNTAKYADAESASVSLTATNGSLTFSISDDGKGFDSSTIVNGAGLTGMADRLDTVVGAVTITSTPGEGTVIMGTVPVQQLVNIQ